MNRVRHAEIINIVVYGMKISVSHKTRTPGKRILESAAYDRHSREVVFVLIRRFGIVRITEYKTVFMETEITVGNGAVIGIIAAGKKLIPVRSTLAKSIIIRMT